MHRTKTLSWDDVEDAVNALVEQIGERKFDTIIAVMRGGLVPARLLAAKLGVQNMVVWDGKDGVAGEIRGSALIVDDIADTGVTAIKAKAKFNAPIAVLVSKSSTSDYEGVTMTFGDPTWIVFCWEGTRDEVGVRQNDSK